MWVLLNKTVGNFTNPRVEAVGGVQIAAIAFPKIVVKGRRERKLRPAETVDSLPVIAHGKQRRVFILRPQRRKQRSALRRNILKLIHQNVFPRADEAPFLQNDNGLMD